jgi:hypothetical protein
MEVLRTWRYSILATVLGFGVAQAAQPNAPQSQQSFASAAEAAEAFVVALRGHREADLRAILGSESDRFVNSGDPYSDQELQEQFVALYDEKHVINQNGPGHAELDVGPNRWPLPIPLVESNGRWSFDAKAGVQAIIDRRIGRNELSVIRALHTCVDAERDYFVRAKLTTGSGVYATRLISALESHDGLYWPVAAGETENPLESPIDVAQGAANPHDVVDDEPIQHDDYYFRILKAQGQHGDGGAKSYIEFGRMTGGFALIAWPVEFQSTGIMTFIVGPSGEVHQKNLGPDTARIAEGMMVFEPDPTCLSMRRPIRRRPATMPRHPATHRHRVPLSVPVEGR